MHYMRGHLNGNPYLGIFACATDSHLLIPPGAPAKMVKEMSRVLGAMPVEATVGGTELIGTMVAANSNGILLPMDMTRHEVETISAALNKEPSMLDTKYNALGNLILANDRGAVVARVYGTAEVRAISRALEVEVRKGTISNLGIVGSLCCATNSGAIVSPNAADEEVKLINETLQVEAQRGTANLGVEYVGTCILANSKGVVAGIPTTGIEMGMIQEAFEGTTW